MVGNSLDSTHLDLIVFLSKSMDIAYYTCMSFCAKLGTFSMPKYRMKVATNYKIKVKDLLNVCISKAGIQSMCHYWPISPWYKLQKFTKWYHWEGLCESYIIGKLKISRFQIQLIAVSNFQRKCSSEYFFKMADNRWKITKEKQKISFLHSCPSIVKPLHSRPP